MFIPNPWPYFYCATILKWVCRGALVGKGPEDLSLVPRIQILTNKQKKKPAKLGGECEIPVLGEQRQVDGPLGLASQPA